MNTKRRSTPFITTLALLLLACVSSASETIPTPAMIGHWTGDAEVIVSWCQQKNLPLTLDIHADGSVTGKVGDATLTKGRLKRNRGWLGKRLKLKTDYIITGDLTGAIVAAEGITRSGVNIPLNLSGGTFVGGLHTTGSAFGGKERMILSAGLTLTRTNRP